MRSIEQKIANLLRIAASDPGPQGKTARKIANKLMEEHDVHVVLDVTESKQWDQRSIRVSIKDRAWVIALTQALAPKHACNAYYSHVLRQGFGYLIISGKSEKLDAFIKAFSVYERIFRSMSFSPSFLLGCALAVKDMFKEHEKIEREIRLERQTSTTAIALSRKRIFMPPLKIPTYHHAKQQGETTTIIKNKDREPPIVPFLVDQGYFAMRKVIERREVL